MNKQQITQEEFDKKAEDLTKKAGFHSPANKKVYKNYVIAFLKEERYEIK